ncbi:alpha/beta-hydrolase, partial [Coprinellus micaceus]
GAGLLWYGQNYLIYPSAYPPGSRTDVARPSDFGIPYEDLELKTPDDILLRCYLLLQKRELSSSHPDAAYLDVGNLSEDQVRFRTVPPNIPEKLNFIASRPTVLMFHGNGGNHGHRIPLAKIFYMRMRCNVFMLSYRGYGLSDGSPSEKGLQTDAQTALSYVLSHPALSQSPIILYGQSIGGAVSIDLASKNPSRISALILENTFTSLPSLVPHALPVLGPVSFLCHQKWDSINKVPLIPATTPILMLSGMQDEIVPKEHMRALWDAVETERAKYMEFEEGGHNDTCVQQGYWSAIIEFVESLAGDKERRGSTTPVRSRTTERERPKKF